MIDSPGFQRYINKKTQFWFWQYEYNKIPSFPFFHLYHNRISIPFLVLFAIATTYNNSNKQHIRNSYYILSESSCSTILMIVRIRLFMFVVSQRTIWLPITRMRRQKSWNSSFPYCKECIYNKSHRNHIIVWMWLWMYRKKVRHNNYSIGRGKVTKSTLKGLFNYLPL